MTRTLRHAATLYLALAFIAGCMPVPGSDDPPVVDGEDEAFLEDVQARTFDWFWDETPPGNGLVPDRAPSKPFSSIAAVGFGLTAYGVGVERGYITRDQALERTLNTLRFFWDAPMSTDPVAATGYKGFYYHFLYMDSGLRYRTNELSSIDTALLMLGVLFSREYFDRDDPREAEVRALADSLYLRVEWDWMQPRAPLISMSWGPERGPSNHDYKGFDEAMFLYLLGLGSPTHPVHEDAWKAFTETYEWGEFYGQEYIQFSPLFGYHYTHVWVDPRSLQDDYMRERDVDYYDMGRRATLAHRAYAIENPGGFKDYSEDIWGLTASDGPAGVKLLVDGDSVRFYRYTARGASLRYISDDGTIAPTAAGGSIIYAPEVVLPALRAMRDRYGDHLYNHHGFADAFNPTFTFTDVDPAVLERGDIDPEMGWFDSDRLGIDQGPILLNAENYRTGFIWEVMQKSPYLNAGLCKAGFTADWLTCS